MVGHEVSSAAPLASTAGMGDEHAVWTLLESVPDPEIPVLSVVDLGIIRHVRWSSDPGGSTKLHVGITPTYSGCPATEVIRQSVLSALHGAGYSEAVVEDVLFPPWTSDWVSEQGRQKLRSFGIAPPSRTVSSPRQMLRETPVACPRCASLETQRISEFGSTPCKAHYRCTACLEPFDHFKCI